MNWTTKLKLAIGRTAIKVANISFLPNWVRATFIAPLFANLVAEGVRINSAVFSCLTTLLWGFGEPNLNVIDDDTGEILGDHKLQKLLDRPNPDMTGREFRQTLLLYAAISGNGYAWIQRNGFGEPIALWPFNDSQVSVMPGKNTREGVVKYYFINDGTSTESGQTVAKEDMIHFKFLPDGANPEKGYGGLQAAARDIDTDNEMGVYTFSLLRNNAIPPVVVTMAEGDIVDEDVAERLRQTWRERLGGMNRGLPAFLEHGMEVKTLGSELNEAAYESLHNFPEARIAAALRVPPILAGLKVGLDNSTYSNYGEARSAFTEDTLSPLWRAFAEVFSKRLTEDDAPISIEFDLSDIRSLQDDVNELWTRVTNAFNAGLITRAEAKTEIGIDIFEFDDVYKVQGATYFIAAGQNPDVMTGLIAGATQTTEPATETDIQEDEETPEDDGIMDDESKSFKTNNPSTTLFAFWLPETTVNYLPPIDFGSAVPGKNLHMTIAVFDKEISEDDISSAATQAFSKVPVVIAEFEDTQVFEKARAVVLRASGDSIHAFRQNFVHELQKMGHQPLSDYEFSPHVTISYLGEEESMKEYSFEPFTLTFDSLTIATENGRQTIKEFSPKKPMEFNIARAEEAKSKETARAFGRALQRTRFATAGRMEAAMTGYFNALADRVSARLRDQGKSLELKAGADELITPEDEKILDELVKRYYSELAIATAGIVETSLGIEIGFDLRNPALMKTLEDAGHRVVMISETTRKTLAAALKEAAELGLSVDEIVRGTDDFKGIYGIVRETYKGRSRTIARTELGDAQNKVTLDLYERSELVEQVMVLDNGFEDSHETCTWIDGQIRPLEWTKSDHSEGPSPDGVKNPLQHPNCVRTFAPYFGREGR